MEESSFVDGEMGIQNWKKILAGHTTPWWVPSIWSQRPVHVHKLSRVCMGVYRCECARTVCGRFGLAATRAVPNAGGSWGSRCPLPCHAAEGCSATRVGHTEELELFLMVRKDP